MSGVSTLSYESRRKLIIRENIITIRESEEKARRLLTQVT